MSRTMNSADVMAAIGSPVPWMAKNGGDPISQNRAVVVDSAGQRADNNGMFLVHTVTGTATDQGEISVNTITINNSSSNVRPDGTPNLMAGLRINHNFGGGWAGYEGLHIESVLRSPSAPGSAGTSYYAACSLVSQADCTDNGTPNNYLGSLYGLNENVRIGAAAKWFGQVIGKEVNTGAYAGSSVNDRIGVQVVDLSGVGGAEPKRISAAYSVNGGDILWKIGFCFGAHAGGNGIAADGTLIGWYAQQDRWTLGTVRTGIDFMGYAFSLFSLRLPGATIDGVGNSNFQELRAKNVVTRDGIIAQTATVSGITILKGGVYSGVPTLTIDPPPGSGNAATAIVNAMGLAVEPTASGDGVLIQYGGNGYIVGDIVTLVGGSINGADVSTNGTFAANPVSGSQSTVLNGWQWVKGGGTSSVSWVSGAVTLTGDGTNWVDFIQSITTVPGTTYTVEFDSTDSVVLYVGTVFQGAQLLNNTAPGGVGIKRTFTATTTTSWIHFEATSTAPVLTNVSVKSVVAPSVPGKYKVESATGGGNIKGLSLYQAGVYNTLPASPIALSGGSGSGAYVWPRWTIVSTQIKLGGSNYPPGVAPNVTCSGVTLFRNSDLLVTISVAQAALKLNPGGYVIPPLNNYANDTAAAAGGVPIGALYRTGNAVMVRLT